MSWNDGARKRTGPTSELESEMSPGMLLSTGYIAGGSIAGVLVSFLSFSDTLPDALAIGKDLPYQTITALITFVLLAVFLVLVGRGWLLKTGPASPEAPRDPDSTAWRDGSGNP